MTDQAIVADVTPDDVALARDFVDEYRDSEYAPDRTLAVARVLQALLPPPPRPTLEGMLPEERHACRWMQADVDNRSVRYVIANPCDAEGDAALTSADGEIEWFSPDRVTPRPDLPRMMWPSDREVAEAPAPAPTLPEGWRLANHQTRGRVIVTNTTPNRNGYVYYVCSSDRDLTRLHWDSCTPDELTYLDTAPDPSPLTEGDHHD